MNGYSNMANEELFEIYLEDLQEVIVNLGINLPKLKNNLKDSEAQSNCTRFYHTLKGNSAIIGAPNLQEFFKTFEFSLKHNTDVKTDLVEFLIEHVEDIKPILERLKSKQITDIDAQEVSDIKKLFEPFS